MSVEATPSPTTKPAKDTTLQTTRVPKGDGRNPGAPEFLLWSLGPYFLVLGALILFCRRARSTEDFYVFFLFFGRWDGRRNLQP